MAENSRKGVIHLIYYTADLHLGHVNVIRHCDRPFVSVEEMDEVLIRNWNSRVHKNDTVYIVGNLFFRNRCPCESYLDELKGRKHLVIGNHDSSWMKKTNWPGYFESVNGLITMKDNGRLVTMCHYPMMTWPDSRHDSYMVFGHIHNSTAAGFWPLIRANPRMLNAGVDINGFVPVTLEEMIQSNERFKEAHPTASGNEEEPEGEDL